MSVYQRNGHWYFDVTIDKTRKRKAVKKARNAEEAKREETEYRNRVYNNLEAEEQNKPELFLDFVENKYKPYAKAHKKGYLVELSVLKVLIKKFGKFELNKITAGHIKEFKLLRATEETNRGKLRSKATVNRDVAVLSAILNLAVDYNLIEKNPINRKIYGSELKVMLK